MKGFREGTRISRLARVSPGNVRGKDATARFNHGYLSTARGWYKLRGGLRAATKRGGRGGPLLLRFLGSGLASARLRFACL